MPLLINIVTALIIYFVPFTTLYLKYNFYRYLNERVKVIKQIENGKLNNMPVISNERIQLTKDYGHISAGNTIYYQGFNDSFIILFYTFLGIFDNYSGYVYCSKSLESLSKDFILEYKEIEKISDHWYWIASY